MNSDENVPAILLQQAARLAGKREAAAALGRWLRHDDGCPGINEYWPALSCRCGLSAKLEVLNG